MLNIKSSALVQKSPFKDLNLSFGDKGLVFICGKKESSAKNLIKYIGGIEYLPGLNIQIDDFVLDSQSKLEDYRLYNIGFIFGNVQYIENETKQYNTESREYLTVIEERVKDIIANALEAYYGENWIINKGCGTRKRGPKDKNMRWYQCLHLRSTMS